MQSFFGNPNEIAAETPVAEASAARVISKIAFRKRMSIQERVAFDNIEGSESLSADEILVVRTIKADLALQDVVDLDDVDLQQLLALMEEKRLIAPERAKAILG